MRQLANLALLAVTWLVCTAAVLSAIAVVCAGAGFGWTLGIVALDRIIH